MQKLESTVYCFCALLIWICKSKAFDTTVCQGDELRVSCPKGHFLVFDEAAYGRSDPETCTPGNTPVNHVCQDKAAVLSYLNRHCYGRRECNVTVNDDVLPLAERDPCADKQGVHKYMHATFRCVTDDDVTEMCTRYLHSLGDRSSGYLRSRQYPEKYPMNEDCVAKLVARQGYSYRMWLLDLDVENRQGTGCYDWLVVTDLSNPARHRNFCGRLDDIHTSETGYMENIQELSVSFRSDPMNTFHGYLIKYEEHETIPEHQEL